jgi:hypothetical protein
MICPDYLRDSAMAEIGKSGEIRLWCYNRRVVEYNEERMVAVKQISRPLPIALLFALLGVLSFRVEDGQFTREYSRIYTALVLSVGGILLLMVAAGIYRATRRKTQNAF